jgi:hypothetical protein
VLSVASCAAVALVCAVPVSPAEEQASVSAAESPLYFPAHVGNTWYFQGYRNGEPGKLLRTRAEVVGSVTREGREYALLSAPQFDIRYLVRVDPAGVRMGSIRFPFPFLRFSVEVRLSPEMPIIEFPLAVGARWHYQGQGRATLLGLLPVTRSIVADFECLERRRVTTPAGEVDAFHVRALVDQGDGKGRHTEEYWWGRGIGYAVARTSTHFAEVVGYRIWDEDSGQWKTALPDHPEQFR